MVASGLILSGCDSSEPRSAEADYADAATNEDTKENATRTKDAGAEADGSKGTQVGNAGSGQGDQKCGDTTCKAPATCSDNKCACPEGYEDVKGDGSECKDIDECKERKADCSRGSVCKNEPGSFKCECNGPAYAQDGDDCKCADGYERGEDGFCAGADGKSCADGIDCKNGNCEGGICCAVSCGEPGACQLADGAKCSDDGKSCIYPRAEDGATCDDSKACTKDGTCKEGKCQESKEATNCNDGNPCTDDSCEEPNGCRNQNNTATCDDGTGCTSEDKCNAGQCKGTDKDCSGSADICNVGACNRESGECVKEPRTVSVTCDDSNSCTTGDSCKDGTCTGSTNACGANATACEPGSGGEPNACTCASDFVDFEGRCVPTNDECQSDNPCSDDADCVDPSNTDGDVTCTCKPGFSGNGVDCIETDPCANNPCGMGGTCTNDNQGSYTCACPAGTREVGGKCGCDLSGTFGVKSTQTVSWQDVDQFLEDGVVQTAMWLLQRQSYDADGNLRVEITECGGSTFDLCSVPFPPFLGAEAYGQYAPQEVWGTAAMPRTTITVSVPDSQPGAAFRTAEFALLNGIQLADPLGPWPSDRRNVAGSPDSSGTPVNGATWLDPDNDGSLGLTTYGVGPGGEQRNGDPDPPVAYGARSSECPRLSGGERYPYAYPPAIPNGSLSVQRVKRFFAAQRATLAYDGKIDSCDTLTGAVTGPDNGQLKLDARVSGCVRVDGSGEVACAAGTVDFLDQQPQTQNLTDARFTLKRISDGASCADVRDANYD